MSLFSKLLRLQSEDHLRLEDFHTEIVAHVLKSDHGLTLRWLRYLGFTGLNEPSRVEVVTQKSFVPIEKLHTKGSRPDIVLEVTDGELYDVVFIESKVGSTAGADQLVRYRDQLAAMPDARSRSLVYITRDYEPVQLTLPATIKFIQKRWSDFHRFLVLQPPTDTIRELLKFMKENNMSQSHRFTTIEILALTNHRRALTLMDATMWETVAEKFEKVCGGMLGLKKKVLQQFRDENRYVMFSGHGERWQFEFLLGYWFPDEQLSDSPDVGAEINVNPKATERPTILEAIRKFSIENKGPRSWNLGNVADWQNISCKMKLEQFLAAADHVAAIKKWFEDLLDDAAAFRKQNPKLPWSPEAGKEEED